MCCHYCAEITAHVSVRIEGVEVGVVVWLEETKKNRDIYILL